jgi:hypothetical protein
VYRWISGLGNDAVSAMVENKEGKVLNVLN